MNFREIFESSRYAALSLSERGAVLGAYLHNVATGGEVYLPQGKEEKVILDELSTNDSIVFEQMDLDTLSTGFMVTWARDYLVACRKAGIIHGETGLRNSGLVERARVRASSVGYRELGADYEGFLPTSRYESIQQVFSVTEDLAERVKQMTGSDSVHQMLQGYYEVLMTSPQKRPSADNMPTSIIKFIKKQSGHAKGVELAILGAIDA